MNDNSVLETPEDIRIIKEHILLPVLLDILTRDMDLLRIYENRIVYNHVLSYLKEVEGLIFTELQSNRKKMKIHHIKIINTEMNALGIKAEYKVRGYIHHFTMLRSMVKAELLTMLMNMRRGLE